MIYCVMIYVYAYHSIAKRNIYAAHLCGRLQDCASDAAKPLLRPSEAQRRFATENPHWDNERRIWVERNGAAEVVDSEEELVRASKCMLSS